MSKKEVNEDQVREESKQAQKAQLTEKLTKALTGENVKDSARIRAIVENIAGPGARLTIHGPSVLVEISDYTIKIG